MSRPSCGIDLEAAEFVLDPYPQLAAQRCAGPIGWHEASRTWIVVAHSPERRPTFVLRGNRTLPVAGSRAGVPR